ncbi:4-(cytidine 5'-diphospho)-2-C-methyl-D-erythritol kinase [Nocardioides sp.]|uniref:4-(cytidine 5'-diphospho)-2-C-methyl-D-erythritol kinase n=1 Tax=Nocardioides sp. TaxID=35761 RepID=UPI002B26BD41|nr:4-(cytidine 5'-diphospho)-2-C-methyl-D-erythritol kinase [Nocardioides sp.]
MNRFLGTAPVTVRAAAKINLHLGVGAPRDDGFHPLTTVYQAIGLCDDVTATPGGPGVDDLQVEVRGSDWIDVQSVPADERNLAHRAASALATLHGRDLNGLLQIEKAIPVAGGLAGGSADAAAALVALDRAHDLRTSDDDLLRIAAELGSDVPFALIGGTALGTGRGELVEPVGDVGTWWWVLVPDREGLSTPDVYRHFDKLYPDAPEEPPGAEMLLGALRTGQPVSLARTLHNDLQDAAVDLRPELGELITRGESEGALRGMVSGSGPTCVFLCESADHARDLAGALMRSGHPTVLVANGAVAGAHLVKDHA